MLFKVVKVNDNGTLKVSPAWEWKSYQGHLVSASDPELERLAAGSVQRLRELLLNKEIELVNARETFNDNKLHCDVLIDGVKVGDYVKESF